MRATSQRAPTARPRVVVILLAAAVVVLAGLIVVGPVRTVLSGCALAQDRCVRILFLGNSYTSVNDLPATFAALARAGGVPVEVSAIAPGGQTLAGHAAAPDVRAAIAGTRWTAVVLQEQSEIPAVPEAVDAGMRPAAASLVGAIRAAGAEPILFETWAHRDGWPERGLDRAAMQAAINASYASVADELRLRVVPAGAAWTRAASTAPGIELWQADGSHPTAAGTYLVACLFYRDLVGRSPLGLGETGGLPSADAATLQAVAAAVIP